ncbi:MAG: hypothetical protein UR94_C0037G0003 [Parcubacteria group bacterium GW2011_GWA2_36_10]|nr:MAG: hypothetical protein UR94_C0037G0003 [Parcubacteria group bacterium GW2011_GWA2_36_10]
MFEHLVPSYHLELDQKRSSKRWRFYFVSFLLASLSLVFALSWSKGPASKAEVLSPKTNQLKVAIVDQNTTEVLPQAINNVLFSFVLQTEQNTSLHSLAISAPEIIKQDIFKDQVRLYEGQTQIGSWEWTEDDKMLFKLDNYSLSPGTHDFQLRADNLHDSLVGQTLTFGFQQAQDIVTSDGHSFYFAKGEFPLFKASVKVLEHSQILAYNNLSKTKFLAPLNINTLVADFALSSQGESFAIRRIDFLASKIDSADTFYLASHGQMLAKAEVQQDHLFFNLSDLVLKNDQDLNLQLWANLNSGDNYEFTLANLSAKGFLSGEEVDNQVDLVLSSVEPRIDVLQVKTDFQQSLLTDDWDSVFKINLQANHSEEAALYKLNFQVTDFGLNILDWDLWVNGQAYAVKPDWQGQLLTFDFGENGALIKQGLEIELLVKVKILGEQARLQLTLLGDETTDSANFLWSSSKEKYNAYLLPDFPVTPVILEQ